MENILTNKYSTNKYSEVIFVGLPGPTHNYGGLSSDNIASASHQGDIAHPAEAALQVLELAKMLISLGQIVAIIPPQLRPHLPVLRQYFNGDDKEIIAQAASSQPKLLESLSSSSAMWIANAATITAPEDSLDNRLHITIANLHSNLHRRIEAEDTYRVMRRIFSKVPRVILHPPLAAELGMRDEGAANHLRLATSHGAEGLNIFVYGTDDNPRDPESARQSIQASQAIITKHNLYENAAICLKQNPSVIEQGVFHNDVIAVANEDFLLVHEEAFALGSADINYISESYAARTGNLAKLRIIKNDELTVSEAVENYFFNSQIISLPDSNKQAMAIIAPEETKELHGGKGWKLLESILGDNDNPIIRLEKIDLKQSMKNGGGPACLRLRVLLDEEQKQALKANSNVILNEENIARMENIIKNNYPENLSFSDINYDLYLNCEKIIREIFSALGIG